MQHRNTNPNPNQVFKKQEDFFFSYSFMITDLLVHIQCDRITIQNYLMFGIFHYIGMYVMMLVGVQRSLLWHFSYSISLSIIFHFLLHISFYLLFHSLRAHVVRCHALSPERLILWQTVWGSYPSLGKEASTTNVTTSLPHYCYFDSTSLRFHILIFHNYSSYIHRSYSYPMNASIMLTLTLTLCPYPMMSALW